MMEDLWLAAKSEAVVSNMHCFSKAIPEFTFMRYDKCFLLGNTVFEKG